MSEGSESMIRLTAASAPMARDLAFEIAVLARIEQHRFRRGVAANLALAMTAILVLALIMPGLELGWQQSFAGLLGNGAIAATLLAATLSLQWWMTREV